MRLDKQNTYLFNIDNKYNIIKRDYKQLFEGSFVIALTVTPDYKSISKLVGPSQYYEGCIVGATGMHQGAFISGKPWGDGKKAYFFSYQWWENVGEKTERKTIDIQLDPIKDKTFSLYISKFNSKFYIDFKGRKFSKEFQNIVDYQNSLKWVGCGNNLGVDKPTYDESYACVYYGEISRLHIQDKLMSRPSVQLLFEDYEKFKNIYLYGEDCNSVLFSSDFSESTPYKIKDFSLNKNNLIKYDPMWFTE